jgi:hypothetical protein
VWLLEESNVDSSALDCKTLVRNDHDQEKPIVCQNVNNNNHSCTIFSLDLVMEEKHHPNQLVKKTYINYIYYLFKNRFTEINAWQFVLESNLLRSQMLLDRHRKISTTLYRRIIGNDNTSIIVLNHYELTLKIIHISQQQQQQQQQQQIINTKLKSILLAMNRTDASNNTTGRNPFTIV